MKRNLWVMLLSFCIPLVTLIAWKGTASLSRKRLVAPHRTRNLVIITFDGCRWKEIFRGADSTDLFGTKFRSQNLDSLKKYFWSDNLEIRREKLAPFFWDYLVKHGQLYGNRDLGNKVDVRNPYWFSYPGYNEIFTGYPDPKVNSNSYGYNPNINVLEYINEQPKYKNKVVAFCAWDAFYRILNEPGSHLLIKAGYKRIENIPLTDSATFKLLESECHWPPHGNRGVNPLIVYSRAKQYTEQHHPSVLYISWATTDTYGHEGKYGAYLDAIHNFNIMIRDLWRYLQQDPFYKNNTTLFVTVDHGRGYGNLWTTHGSKEAPHSNEIWFAVMGPDTKPLGEINKPEQLYQNQYAKTFAAFLGLNFTNGRPIGSRIKDVMDKR